MSAVLEARATSARLRRRIGPTLATGSLIIALSLVLAFAPGWFAPYDPLAFDYAALLQPPSLAHPFGTDNFGRDMLSRVIWAYRIDMQVWIFVLAGVVAVAIGAFTISFQAVKAARGNPVKSLRTE